MFHFLNISLYIFRRKPKVQLQRHIGNMQQDVNENNTLYLSFKDVHPCWLFVGAAVVKMLYVVPGILLNLSLLFVTIRSKRLCGTANFLLALNSFFELLHQPGHLLIIWTALSGTNFLAMSSAVRIVTVPMFGLIAVGPSLFFTGVDRLIAITSFSFYQRINTVAYLCLITALCSLYSGYGIFLVQKTAQLPQWSNYQSTGNMGDLFQGDASQFYNTTQMALNGLTIGIYLVVGVVIRLRSANIDQGNRRLFRSLLAIISLGLGGYFLMRIFTLVVMPNVSWSQTTGWTVRQAVAIPLNLSAGSNAPILFLTSSEYRKAYRKELLHPFLALILRMESSADDTNNNNNNNQNVVNQNNNIRMNVPTNNNRINNNNSNNAMLMVRHSLVSGMTVPPTAAAGNLLNRRMTHIGVPN